MLLLQIAEVIRPEKAVNNDGFKAQKLFYLPAFLQLGTAIIAESTTQKFSIPYLKLAQSLEFSSIMNSAA